jgi:hypothetical protein
MASADELGRPLGVSIALAFVCYWAVMLWPSRKGGNEQLKRGRRPPQRRNRRIMSGGGEERATTLRAVGRGRDV